VLDTLYDAGLSKRTTVCHTYVTRDSEYVNVKFFNIKLFLH